MVLIVLEGMVGTIVHATVAPAVLPAHAGHAIVRQTTLTGMERNARHRHLFSILPRPPPCL